ncbi:hypothetical protein JOM56_000668 [Amanita muscaria]
MTIEAFLKSSAINTRGPWQLPQNYDIDCSYHSSPEREGRASLFNNIAQRPTTPPITPTSQAVIPLPFTFPSTGNEAAFRPPFFTLPSTDSLDAALLVSSREAAVSSIAALLQTLDDNEVQLATSRKPILMDETRTHENPMAGYVELGCLAALDRSVEFKPAVDCDERWQLIEMQDITIGTPIYVLYIWSSENEGTLPVLWGPGALHNPNGDIAAQANAAVLLIESPYIALFNELIINAPTAKSTFTLIIFVKCARRTGLFTVSGRHQLNTANMVLAFRRQDNTAYLQPKTFHNHRGWFFQAETLYETLLQAYPHHSQMSYQLIKECTMMDWLGDLLQSLTLGRSWRSDPQTWQRSSCQAILGSCSILQRLVTRLFGATPSSTPSTAAALTCLLSSNLSGNVVPLLQRLKLLEKITHCAIYKRA